MQWFSGEKFHLCSLTPVCLPSDQVLASEIAPSWPVLTDVDQCWLMLGSRRYLSTLREGGAATPCYHGPTLQLLLPSLINDADDDILDDDDVKTFLWEAWWLAGEIGRPEGPLHPTLVALVLYITTALVQWGALALGGGLLPATTLNPPSFTLRHTVGSNNLMLTLKFKQELSFYSKLHPKYKFKEQ